MDRSAQSLVFELVSRKSRPVFRHRIGAEEVTFMLDTGAETPVWCLTEKRLLRAFPDAEKKEETYKLTGFGVGAVEAAAFVIPEFKLESNDSCYFIKNLQILQTYRPDIGCAFLLSDTVFSNVDTLIYRHGKKQLEIRYYKPEYQCTPIYGNERFKIAVWSQR